MSAEQMTEDLDEQVLDNEAVDDSIDASEPLSVAAKPEGLPEKFWDEEAGTIRTDALAKSYTELERRLSRSVAIPDEDDRDAWNKLFEAAGRPQSPDEYQIEVEHPLVEVDPEVNSILFDAGLNQRQAQMVYELAAEHLVPIMESAVAEIEASRDQERLAKHFGGEDRWSKISDQLKTWASAKLKPEVFETLSSSYEGVLALHQMMRQQEPQLASESGRGSIAVGEVELTAMVRDPRYWRDKDPQFIARVTEGYRNLYGR